MRLVAAARRLGACRQGSLAVIGAVVLGLLVTCAGAGIDISRWHAARTQTVRALDAALLGGARTLQVSHGDRTRAVAAAQQYLEANIAHVPGLTNGIRFSTDEEATQIVSRGAVYIATTLLTLVGIPRLTVLDAREVANVRSAASIGGGATRTEIVLALDLSEHMGAALPGAVAAAKDLFGIIAASDPRRDRHRTSVVPFAEGVALTREFADQVLGPLRPGACPFPGCLKLQRRLVDCVSGDCRGPERAASTCASERDGNDAASDRTPLAAPFTPIYPNRFGTCQPAQAMLPLTEDVDQSARVLDTLSTGGRAAGHLGLAWAWHALAPGWADVWESAAGGSYGDLGRRLASGAAALRKVVILISPGRFDRQYCDGVAEDAPDGCRSPNGSAHAQARAVCAGMRARGVEVFTVAYPFVADPDARVTLGEHCASAPRAHYVARDSHALRQALTDIGLEIATTRLTQ